MWLRATLWEAEATAATHYWCSRPRDQCMVGCSTKSVVGAGGMLVGGMEIHLCLAVLIECSTLTSHEIQHTIAMSALPSPKSPSLTLQFSQLNRLLSDTIHQRRHWYANPLFPFPASHLIVWAVIWVECQPRTQRETEVGVLERFSME